MRRRSCLIALIAAALALTACGDEFSNAVFDDDARFVAAAPSRTQLRIGLGGVASGLPVALVDVSALAESYVTTRRVALDLNAVAFGILRDVDALVATPPAERARGRRVWLPPTSGLDPVTSRFEVSEDGAGGYTYTLGQRRRGDDDGAWQTVLQGAFSPDAGGGAGLLVLDLSAAASPLTGGQRGRIHAGYVIDGAAATVDMAFEGVVLGKGEAPSDAEFFYARDAAGAGTFDFETVDDELGPVALRSRWIATGAGRTDGRIAGVAGAALASECWGEDFTRVYAASAAGSVGDVSACAFADASAPGSAVE